MDGYRSGHKRVAMPKTIDYRFLRAKPPKARRVPSQVHRGEGRQLCDGGGRSLDEKSFESAYLSIFKTNLIWTDIEVVITGLTRKTIGFVFGISSNPLCLLAL